LDPLAQPEFLLLALRATLGCLDLAEILAFKACKGRQGFQLLAQQELKALLIRAQPEVAARPGPLVPLVNQLPEAQAQPDKRLPGRQDLGEARALRASLDNQLLALRAALDQKETTGFRLLAQAARLGRQDKRGRATGTRGHQTRKSPFQPGKKLLQFKQGFHGLTSSQSLLPELLRKFGCEALLLATIQSLE
jgi:hypothetical protein